MPRRPGLIAQSIGPPLQVATLALVIRPLRHGSRRTIGVAATAVAALALLHPISILVVVAAVTYDPGWPATVDDAPVPVRRSGDGLVELLTLAGWLALALLGGRGRRAGRGRPAGPGAAACPD